MTGYYVGLEHIEKDTGKLLGHGNPSEVRSLKSAFSEGDVLYGRLRPNLNKVWRATFSGICSTEILVFRKLQNIDSDFLAYRLLSDDFVQFATSRLSGMQYPRVKFDTIADFHLLLPPLGEQRRITVQVETMLKQISLSAGLARAAHSRVFEYRQALLADAFSGELTRQWRSHEPVPEPPDYLLRQVQKAHRTAWIERAVAQEIRRAGGTATPQLLLNNELVDLRHRLERLYPESVGVETSQQSEIPPGWVWVNWGQIGFAQNGRAFPSSAYTADGIRLLRPGNLAADGTIVWSTSNTRHLPASWAEDFPEFVLGGNELVMNLTAQSLADDFLGRVCLTAADEYCLLNQRIARLSVVETSTRFIYYLFRSRRFRRFVDKLNTGSLIQHISTSQLEPFPIPLPPRWEQDVITNKLDAAWRAMDFAEQRAATLPRETDQLRRSVLRQASQGLLTFRDDTDEDARELLTKVKAEHEQIEKNTHAAKASPKQLKTNMPSAPKDHKPLEHQLERLGSKADSRTLFDAAGYEPEQVLEFYDTLQRSTVALSHFSRLSDERRGELFYRSLASTLESRASSHRFRLIRLWIDEFKNLRDYEVSFHPDYPIDIVLGWNGTGKSNLFESLVIIFRDLHTVRERSKAPETSFGYKIEYEVEGRLVRVAWTPSATGSRRLSLTATPAGGPHNEYTRVKREELPLPRFVFGYYSGPTNRLAEHFLPAQRDHYYRLVNSTSDDPETMLQLLEERRFFCAETHHAKYVMLGFFYKNDAEISRFLEDRLRIIGFESALFVFRKPAWARPGEDETTFWGASGVVRHFLERLQRIAIAPMMVPQIVDDGYRQTREDHLYFLIPDAARLQLLAAEYPDARSFFLALESTDFSRLVHDVKVRVRVRGEGANDVPITFREMSEGEQQLLTVLGLLRFTKSHDSLVLLDEPDTHLNPYWAVDYLRLLSSVMSDGSTPAAEQGTSQILMSTHDPLVIVSLVKEQIHLLKRDPATGRCEWEPAGEDPKGLGFTGILTSDMFGFRSDLDPETLALLDKQAELAGKEENLSATEKKELIKVTAEIDRLGFRSASSDPYYRAFLQAVSKRPRTLARLQKPVLDKSDLAALAEETDEILAELEAEERQAQ
jgi:predicted ATPase